MSSHLYGGRRAALAFAAVLASASLACDGGPTGPKVGDIVVQPSELTLRQHEKHRLLVTVTDPGGTLLTGMAVTFKSLNESLVTVSSIGEVTSVGPAGSTKVRLTAAGFSKDIPVVVQGIPTGVRITPDPIVIPQKGTHILNAKVIDAVGDEIAGEPMVFWTSNSGLITVDPAGVITSVGRHGTATVYANSRNLSASATVTVTQVANGFQVAPSTLLLGTAESAPIRAFLVDLNGAEMAGGTFTFTSSNLSVATVDADGTVRSVGPLGEATVTVGSGTETKTVAVRVVQSAHPMGEIAGTVSVPRAFGVSFTRSGVAYAISNGDGVFRVDPAALTATTVVTGTSGLDLAITADGTRAYVANQTHHRIDLVDLAAGTVLASSPTLGNSALTDLLSANDQSLWVGTGGGITVLDASTLAIQQTIATGTVIHFARHPTQPYIYATGNSSRVHEIDMTTRTIRRTLIVSGSLQGGVVSLDGTELYVADEGGPVQVINLESGVRTASITIGGRSGYGIAMSPDGLRLYVSMPESDRVAIVDLVSRRLVGKLDVPDMPRRLALNPAGTLLLVASEGGTVTVIR